MKNIRLIGWLTLVALGSTTAVVSLGQQPTVPLGIEKVKEGLYLITGSGGNVAARITPNGVVLVNNKFERNYDEITRLVSEVSDQPTSYVIGTHHHGDHMGGNRLFSTQAEIIAHVNARKHMLSNDQPAPPRVVFSQATSLFMGDVEIKAHYFGPGHTDGDVVVEFPTLQTIHTGDLFVNGTPFIDYNNGGNSEDWVKALGRILKLDFDKVIPGHGPIMTKAEVQTFRDKLVTLRARMSQLINQGVTKDNIGSHLYTADLGWPLAPDGLFVSQSLLGLYDEMAKTVTRMEDEEDEEDEEDKNPDESSLQ